MKTVYGVSRNGEHLFPTYKTRVEAQERGDQEKARAVLAEVEGWLEPGQAEQERFYICQTTERDWR